MYGKLGHVYIGGKWVMGILMERRDMAVLIESWDMAILMEIGDIAFLMKRRDNSLEM